MQTSYADLLKSLVADYNQGRITQAAFRQGRALLINAAEAQYNRASAPPQPLDDGEDVTAVQFPPS